MFPKGKHDDQAAQFLDWFQKPFPSQGIYEYYRQLAEAAAQQSKPPPTKTVFAPARWNGSPSRRKCGQPRRPTPCESAAKPDFPVHPD